MDELISSLLENIKTIQNRAESHKEHFRSLNKKAWRQSNIITEGCEAIKEVVEGVENKAE